MGVYEQLSDEDQRAVSQLSKYLIETEGNRFYEQKLVSVRNHIAGNEQLIRQARQFQIKMAEMMQQQAQALAAIGQRVQQTAQDPVSEMMQRYEDPKAQAAFSEKVDRLLKQRTKKKRFILF